MNRQERDEIREKHRCDELRPNYTKFCAYCWVQNIHRVEYPCDVIKILDAWEAEKANDFTDDELEYLVNMTFPWIDTDTGKYLDRPIWDKAHAILEARKENQ